MANNVFYSMSRRGCEPNGKIYQTMVHYLCEERDFGLAFRLCKKSMERNWYPSVEEFLSIHLKKLYHFKRLCLIRKSKRLIMVPGFFKQLEFLSVFPISKEELYFFLSVIYS
ncbi:pentatricopeptide repeat-containing protein [Carex littledalei]|uniref:Pentatricopeptide repeat-containing protein n=1 Tax=Carex littledalei TaxID=544730 RepID=A0A833VL83_9POAL|nr:pentatricopeptide repeat-containing protein [Carex littledalei]